MLRRLPISLRFDDDDSDFYYGFIEQKKNDRELSSLILDLLHVYYENEEVRNIVNEYVISKSPYMHIHEQLERIALEHSKQSVSTNMLNDFNDNARRKVSETPEPVKEDKKDKEEPLLLEAAMTKLEPIIEQKISEMMDRMLAAKSATPEMIKNVTEEVKSSVSGSTEGRTIEIPSVEKPKIEVQSEASEENKPTRPRSFSKLLGSVK